MVFVQALAQDNVGGYHTKSFHLETTVAQQFLLTHHPTWQMMLTPIPSFDLTDGSQFFQATLANLSTGSPPSADEIAVLGWTSVPSPFA